MNTRPRFSFGTNLFDEVGGTASRVADSLIWLESRQNPEGYWGKTSMLEKVVATCHAIMAFQCCGYHYAEEPLARGINFLTKGAGATSDWSFWRLGPLLGIDEYAKLATRDLRTLKERIEKGAGIHPDQFLSIMALKANIISKVWEAAETEAFLSTTLDQWTNNFGWTGRGDTTANALSVLEHYDFKNKEHIWSRSIELLKGWAKPKRDRVVWGTNVSTAYVLYSIVESKLWEDGELQKLAIQASSGLLISRQPKGFWEPEEPPYGGNEDIQEPDFFTAAILRAICAVETKRDPNFLLEVQAALRQKRLLQIQELWRELSDVTDSYERRIGQELEERLKEKTAALDLKKLSLGQLFSSLSVGSWILLASSVVAAGAVVCHGKALVDSFHEPTESNKTLQEIPQQPKVRTEPPVNRPIGRRAESQAEERDR